MEMQLVPCDPPCGLVECPKCHSHGYHDHGPFTEPLAAPEVPPDTRVHVAVPHRFTCARCGHEFVRDIAR